MKPAKFEYVRAESLEHAVQVLAELGDEAKIIAGGQSLMPMLNFRLVKPAVVVDINRIPGLEQITAPSAGQLRFGALARHRMSATDPLVQRLLPILPEVMAHVAHMTVRNRGTFCGSICHADPAAEMPMVAVMFDGAVEIASTKGQRRLDAPAFLTGAMTNALEPGEMVSGITLQPPEFDGWGFEEFSRRHGDFALAACAITLRLEDGAIRGARIGMTGIGETARRLAGLERLVEGRAPEPALFAEMADWLQADLTPNSDLHASADYRRHLAGVLAERALGKAYTRAKEASHG